MDNMRLINEYDKVENGTLNMTADGAVNMKAVGIATTTIDSLGKSSAFVAETVDTYNLNNPTPIQAEDPSKLSSLNINIPDLNGINLNNETPAPVETMDTVEKLDIPVMPSVEVAQEPTGLETALFEPSNNQAGLVSEPLAPTTTLTSPESLDIPKNDFLNNNMPLSNEPQPVAEETSFIGSEVTPSMMEPSELEEVNRELDKKINDLLVKAKDIYEKFGEAYKNYGELIQELNESLSVEKTNAFLNNDNKLVFPEIGDQTEKTDVNNTSAELNSLVSPTLETQVNSGNILPEDNRLVNPMSDTPFVNTNPDMPMVADDHIQAGPGKFVQF